ncbi:chemotaxis protein CheX [Moraxella lincolnii]|uniref:chemotaxis protein CheX n=1 Tax=Lwoffella lincolnii TaxID=90241 RepID=UPI0030CCD99F
MVKAEKLGVFITSVMAFFMQVGYPLEEIGTPYISSNTDISVYDYTGIISITGPLKGSVFVSAPSNLLREVLKVMQEPDTTITLMKDLVGEIANTIAGNARTEFGSEFIISTPKVVDGLPPASYLPKDRRSYIIPFRWRGMPGVIGISVT